MNKKQPQDCFFVGICCDIIKLMEDITKKRNISVQILEWYLLDQPKAILKAWKNLLKFNLNYFSIPLLLKTLFSPWKRFVWPYGRGFNFARYFEAFFSNSISRGIGFILRLFLILIGIFIEVLIFFLGISMLLIWFLLPVILILGLVKGFKIIF